MMGSVAFLLVYFKILFPLLQKMKSKPEVWTEWLNLSKHYKLLK